MSKDVLYIDVEDDITAIISKVKASKEQVVAVVPPKRIGVLQSAVNLQLLNRAAKQADKKLVLITNNQALITLAASAKLPVAKNLQSKPELASITALAVDDGDDIIDGNDLPIGDHAKQAGNLPDDSAEAALASVALDNSPTKEPLKKRLKPNVKVPNFNTFRKKLILGGAALLLLIFFLVWANFIAPRATVAIQAKTDSKSINAQVEIGESLTTSGAKDRLKAAVATLKETADVEFTATGSKNVGNKASGNVTMSNQSLSSTGVAAGTKLTASNGLVFVTDESVTIPASTVGPGCFPTACPGTATVTVTAAAAGAKYNAASGSLDGAPDGADAEFDSPSSGGTDKNVKIVTAADVNKAEEKLTTDKPDDELKNKLKEEFEGEVITVDESFSAKLGESTSSPAIGQEAEGGNATLSSATTYTMFGVEKSELQTFLKETIEEELGDSTEQRIYSDGVDSVQFQDVSGGTKSIDATLVATAQVGPNIDETAVKAEVKGKRAGEIQEALENIQGVEDVSVSFFPFWLNTVPNDDGRITIKFEVDEQP